MVWHCAFEIEEGWIIRHLGDVEQDARLKAVEALIGVRSREDQVRLAVRHFACLGVLLAVDDVEKSALWYFNAELQHFARSQRRFCPNAFGSQISNTACRSTIVIVFEALGVNPLPSQPGICRSRRSQSPNGDADVLPLRREHRTAQPVYRFWFLFKRS